MNDNYHLCDLCEDESLGDITECVTSHLLLLKSNTMPSVLLVLLVSRYALLLQKIRPAYCLSICICKSDATTYVDAPQSIEHQHARSPVHYWSYNTTNITLMLPLPCAVWLLFCHLRSSLLPISSATV